MKHKVTTKFGVLFVIVSLAVVTTAAVMIRRANAANISWEAFNAAGPIHSLPFGELMPIVAQTSTFKPVVITATASGTSSAVRALPLTKPELGKCEGDSPLPIHPPHALPSLPVQDPVQQTSAPSAAVAMTNQTFDGMNQSEACGGCIPPDPVGAVGPNH